jgi:hypothetical protein
MTQMELLNLLQIVSSLTTSTALIFFGFTNPRTAQGCQSPDKSHRNRNLCKHQP